ncbi:DNA (cytosine-5-)-methyltransferase [Capsulimonas corticalis]|uniref:DNA (Cytosine-5-)-methyltransferase n=2 Tax=Capsulimonas corticalis TaxID=2219043 RepID=A0A402CZQ4_9BACT|nr:DNA (cytosine-5-)-methyltransferase [Capsulimonas corticalis]
MNEPVVTAATFTNHPAATNHYNSLPPTVAEFFAGIGLMRMGLERAGWSVEFANDIDPKKWQMYATNYPANHFVLGDIHLIDPATVPTVTLATASFPCTDLSLAGGRAGLAGAQSGAFWGFLNILKGMETRRPPIVLLENVPSFLTSHGGQDFHRAMCALNDLGYAVDAVIIDAAWFVPQSRQRLFVIAVQQELPIEVKTDTFLSKLRPKALTSFISSHLDINWRLRVLPELPSGSATLDEILEDLPANASEWWDEKRSMYLLSQMSDRHREVAEKMIANDKLSYGTVFRRTRNGVYVAELRSDGIAGCLRTPKGGSSQQILIKAGFGTVSVRNLTPRECARLMGAEEYVIDVPRNQALFGFGDAVCVPVVEWISRNYLMPLLVEMNDG